MNTNCRDDLTNLCIADCDDDDNDDDDEDEEEGDDKNTHKNMTRYLHLVFGCRDFPMSFAIDLLLLP